MSPNVFTIPASAPFAETLARGLIAGVDLDKDKLALSKTTIYLPTRRAVRDFPEIFARVMGGAALLPQMRALGDVDEDEFFLDADDSLALLPAIAPLRRRLLLAQLVRGFDKTLTFAQAVGLAASLAGFLDETQTQRIAFSGIEKIVPARFAEHWREVWKFLDILQSNWPAILADEGADDPAARRNTVLAALAQRLTNNPPETRVIAAGSTGSIPATADLLRVIASLPNGAVVLPGLDRELDAESWDDLDPGHPQYGMKQLLGRIGVERKEVRDWQPMEAKANVARETLLREVLRPAPTTDAWRAIAETGAEEIVRGLEGLSVVEAAHPGEEATGIALILRKVLEDKGKTAALVTPDRNLARRVAAEMRRWNIEIDDSAGHPLANTEPGTFLCLLAAAADEHFAPVPLLALLKHPLASGGENTADFRRTARALDRFALRGPRPDPGLGGIARAIDAAETSARKRGNANAERIAALKPWFARIADLLRPLEDILRNDLRIAETVECHGAVAERLAATGAEGGGAVLWRGEAGKQAALFIDALKDAARDVAPVEPSSYAVLFRALSEGPSVRPAFGRHPRLAILGPLEARLQSFDTIVLGGLNEGTWPRAAPIDPWLSRQMRADLLLEQPEREIGLAAHDFATLAAGPRVVLTRAMKSEGSPAIPSRWLQRLAQLTKGLGIAEHLATDAPYEIYARALGEPDQPAERMKPPRPRPPLTERPISLSVTEIETWLRDPYAIYAKHVLRLRPLDPLDAQIGPLERGTSVHTALERFLGEFKDHLPENAAERLIAIAREVFDETGIPHSVRAVWQPRFERAARWFVEAERARRASIQDILLEIKGERTFDGVFTLRCRADRVDILKNGSAAIIDYKTGKPPSDKQVKTLSPQLPLEASILAAGGFKDAGARAAEDLIYIRFSGDADPGELRRLKDVAALIASAEKDLADLIAMFADESHPYLSRVKPFRADQPGDYDHLARVREWSLTGWEGEP